MRRCGRSPARPAPSSAPTSPSWRSRLHSPQGARASNRRASLQGPCRAGLIEWIRTTAAIFLVLIGALLFGYFLAITQTPQRVSSFIVGLGLGPYETLGPILVGYFLLGCVLDPLAMVVLTVPIILPTIFKGVLPFVVTDVVRLALLVAVPQLALYLPAQMG